MYFGDKLSTHVVYRRWTRPDSDECLMMLFARFLKDRRGGVAPLLALGAIPLIASVGAAVDYSRANAARAAMQTALDAAALMVAKETSGQGQNATVYFNANFAGPEVQDIAITVVPSSTGGGTS